MAEQNSLNCIGEAFAEYRYPQFQNSQEFVLDGGVIIDTLANSNASHAYGLFIPAL